LKFEKFTVGITPYFVSRHGLFINRGANG